MGGVGWGPAAAPRSPRETASNHRHVEVLCPSSNIPGGRLTAPIIQGRKLRPRRQPDVSKAPLPHSPLVQGAPGAAPQAIWEPAQALTVPIPTLCPPPPLLRKPCMGCQPPSPGSPSQVNTAAHSAQALPLEEVEGTALLEAGLSTGDPSSPRQH